MALRKVESGRSKNFDQNPPVFSVKKLGFGGKFPPSELIGQQFSLALVNVEFHILCSTANLFGSYVGLLTLCVFWGFRFRVKTTKNAVACPPKLLFFLAILGLIWHISDGFKSALDDFR